uniref:Glycerol uptake protein n=1 Tax=Rhizophora mucronata TaxID=61149 RepID=A0A2P2KKV9_RHIMU
MTTTGPFKCLILIKINTFRGAKLVGQGKHATIFYRRGLFRMLISLLAYTFLIWCMPPFTLLAQS